MVACVAPEAQRCVIVIVGPWNISISRAEKVLSSQLKYECLHVKIEQGTDERSELELYPRVVYLYQYYLLETI